MQLRKKVSTVVQVTFNRTGKSKPACVIYLDDVIFETICDSKTDFWKEYWFRMEDTLRGQTRDEALDQSMSHIEGHYELRDTEKEMWKYPALKLVPEKEERIDNNQPTNYPYEIIVKKMSELQK